MNLIFKINLEHKAPGGKWERIACETSHWPSAQPILENFVRANPGREVRLVAEMIPFPVPDMMVQENS